MKENYKIVQVFLKTISYKLLIFKIPEKELNDKLTYFTREKGLIPKSLYYDFLIATCVSNITPFIQHLQQKETTTEQFQELRSEIVDKILKVNPKMSPDNLIINTNHVVKVKKGPKKDDEKLLSENDFWSKDVYKNIENSKNQKNKLDKSSIQNINDLNFILVQKFWRRIGQYINVKQFEPGSELVILANRSFNTRTSFEQYIITICIEEIEDLFMRLDKIGLPNRVASPILIHELYEICRKTNPFLDFDVYRETFNNEVLDDEELEELNPFDNPSYAHSQGVGDDSLVEALKKKKLKMFKDVTKKELLDLGNKMKKKIIGQNKAIDDLVNAIQRSSVGLRDPEQPIGSFIFTGYTGVGKCHGKGTKIRMYDGSVKNVEDIKVGDVLMGDDSTPRNVLSLAYGQDEMFEVIPKKGGNAFTCNKEHILSLKNSKTKEVIDIPIKDYINKNKSFKHLYKLYRVSVDYPYKEICVDPYFMGLWIGDGGTNRTSITTSDDVIINYLYSYAEELGLDININTHENNKSNTYILTSGNKGGKPDRNVLLNNMRKYGLITGNEKKFIPIDYMINSKDVRKSLLAGLIDSDGSQFNKSYSITTKYLALAEDIITLCRSLGYCAYFKEKIVNGTTYYRVNISGDLSDLPIKLDHKKSMPRQQIKDVKVTGFTIKYIGKDDYYGFVLDGNSRYLLEDFTVTHNTYTAKTLAEELIGSKYGIITVDCSEYSADHEYAKLIGAPSGYIGHEHGGYLTNAVKKNPFSVVLFDEVEKASEKVHQLMLQIMDEARLTDGKGNAVSFKDTIVIMTSNLGVNETQQISKTIGFGDVAKLTQEKRENAIKNSLKKRFKPEFLNRITCMVNFNSLTKKDYLKIIKLELEKLKRNLKLNRTEYSQLNITFDKSLYNYIYATGIDEKFGARPLKRVIEQKISTPLAKKLLKENIDCSNSTVKIFVKKGELVIDIKDDLKDVKIDKPPFYMEAGEDNK